MTAGGTTTLRGPAPAGDGRGPAGASAGGRSRLRRRLLLAGLAPALVGVLFAGKLTLMLEGNQAGRTAYQEQDFEVARDAFAGNDRLNLFEPWVARFNEGDARNRALDLPGAIARFEAALTDVPHEHECTVRINLALTHEAVGDAAAAGTPAGGNGPAVAGDRAAAIESWQAGRDALAAGQCSTDSGGGPEQTTIAKTVDDRLRDKIEQDPPPEQPPDEPPPPDQPPPPPPDEQDDRVQELEQRNGDGEEYRDEVQDLEENPYDNWSNDYQW